MCGASGASPGPARSLALASCGRAVDAQAADHPGQSLCAEALGAGAAIFMTSPSGRAHHQDPRRRHPGSGHERQNPSQAFFDSRFNPENQGKGGHKGRLEIIPPGAAVSDEYYLCTVRWTSLCTQSQNILPTNAKLTHTEKHFVNIQQQFYGDIYSQRLHCTTGKLDPIHQMKYFFLHHAQSKAL